jgi:hypothetical protein
VKFTCDGYRDPFINERQRVLSRRVRTSSSSQTKPASSCETEKTEKYQALIPLDLSHRSPVPQSVSIAPWKDELVLRFLAANSGPSIRNICRDLMAKSSQADSMQRLATRQAFLALATTFFGVGHSQIPLVNDGSRLYGQALQMLNKTISDISPNGVTEAITSVIALCFYEVSRGSLSTTFLPTSSGHRASACQRPHLAAPHLWPQATL